MGEETATVVAESPDQTKFSDGWNDPEFGDEKAREETDLEDKVEVETQETETETEQAAAETEVAATETEEATAETETAETETEAAETETTTEQETAPSYRADIDRLIGKVEEYKDETKAQVKSEVERILGSAKPADKKPQAKAEETKPAPTQKLDEDKINKELEGLEGLDPEVAKAVKAIVSPLVGHANKQQEVIDSLRVGASKRDADDAATEELRERINTVETAHPGAVALTQTKPFTDWLDKTPLANRIFTTSDDPKAIIDVISEYKKANPPKEETDTEEEATTTQETQTEEEDPKTRVRREAAETITPKKKSSSQPPRALTDDEGFEEGWGDPEFAAEDKERKNSGRVW